MEFGLLLIRVVLALILFTHATQKLFGWFGGNGVVKQGEIFASLGLRPGRLMVLMAGGTELLAALLFLAGAALPVAALLASSTMLVAGLTVHLKAGSFWNVAGGGEYPYTLAAVSIALGFTGAGSLSLDHLLASGDGNPGVVFELFSSPPSWVGGLVLILSGAVTAVFFLILRRNNQPGAEAQTRT